MYRFVNGEDIVTRVPLSGPYHHVGAAKFIDEEGVIHDQEEQDASSGLLRNLTSVVGSVGTLSKGLIRGLPTDALVDHAPIYYAVHIWNNYIRS